MASTVFNGNDRSEKWHRPFQMATTVCEREICVGDVNNRLRHIQVSLNAHQMKHDDHQANLYTLQNEQSNQSVELARLIRDTAAVQERITRLEGRVNAQGTMLRNVSDSVRGLATLTRRVDIENL